MVTEDNALAYSPYKLDKKGYDVSTVYNDAKGEVKEGIRMLTNIDFRLRKTMS